MSYEEIEIEIVLVPNCVLHIYTFWIGFSFRIQGDFQSVVAQWEVHLPLVLKVLGSRGKFQCTITLFLV